MRPDFLYKPRVVYARFYTNLLNTFMSEKELPKNEELENIENNLEEITPKTKAEESELNVISSAELIKTEEEFSQPLVDEDLFDELEDLVDELEETELIDPIFKELSEPKLPELPKDNRARLQMQSPTRAFLYWSFENNPFQTLNQRFRQSNRKLSTRR